MSARLDGATRATFRSFRSRNFRLFFGGQLVSQTGTWVTMIAQTLLVLDRTGSGVAIGFLTACQFLPILLLGPWAGTIADRSDKRRLLLFCQAAAMVQTFTLAAVVFAGGASLPAIYVLATVQGVITAFENPVRRAFVVEMVEPSDVANAVSLNSAIMTGSRVIGPAVAGALVLTVGYGWAFLIDGFSYLALLIALRKMRVNELHASVPTERGRGQIREGLRAIASLPDLLIPLTMTGIIGIFAFNFQVTIPLLVTGPLHGADNTFTLLFSVLSIGSLVGALSVARQTQVTSRQMVKGAVGFGVGMFGLAAAPTLPLAFAAALFLGWSSMSFMTACTARVQILAPPHYRGRVLAVQSMVFFGSTPIGGVILGWLSDLSGPRAGLALGGVACFVSAAWGRRMLQRAEATSEPIDLPPDVAPDPGVTLAD